MLPTLCVGPAQPHCRPPLWASGLLSPSAWVSGAQARKGRSTSKSVVHLPLRNEDARGAGAVGRQRGPLPPARSRRMPSVHFVRDAPANCAGAAPEKLARAKQGEAGLVKDQRLPPPRCRRTRIRLHCNGLTVRQTQLTFAGPRCLDEVLRDKNESSSACLSNLHLHPPSSCGHACCETGKGNARAGHWPLPSCVRTGAVSYYRPHATGGRPQGGSRAPGHRPRPTSRATRCGDAAPGRPAWPRPCDRPGMTAGCPARATFRCNRRGTHARKRGGHT